MSASDAFGLVVRCSSFVYLVYALFRGENSVTGQGIFQILFYVVVLIALGYPLGPLHGPGLLERRCHPRPAAFRGDRARLLPAARRRRRREQDWKGYAKTVLVFSAVFSVAPLR